MILKISIIIHVLAATISTGGHLSLVFMYLLPSLKTKDLSHVRKFEKRYEKVAVPSIALLIITGLYQSYVFIPSIYEWFNFTNSYSIHITVKLLMMVAIILFILNKKFRVGKQPVINYYSYFWHILTITILTILLVIAGLSFRLDIF